jgi:hypothetical protein
MLDQSTDLDTVIVVTATKRCRACGVDKPVTDFYQTRKARSADGYGYQCRLCIRTGCEAWRIANREASAAHRLKYAHGLKEQVFAKYGEACASCGFSDRRALQLDHVHDDGAAERHPRGRDGWMVSRVTIWKRAIEDQTGRYQILCANCNTIKSADANRRAFALRKKKDLQ